MGRKAGLKQIMEVETMKKLFKRGLAMAFCLLCLALGQVQAFDFMADVDEVSRDPWKAYTLYLRMPWMDYINNFDKAPGWSSRRNMGTYRYYIKEDSINSSVKEVVEGAQQMGQENGMKEYRIKFFTDSVDITERIFERLVSNCQDSLGEPCYANTIFNNGTCFKLNVKAWKRKSERGKSDCLIVRSMYGIKNTWWMSGTPFKSRCLVYITRLYWPDKNGIPYDNL